MKAHTLCLAPCLLLLALSPVESVDQDKRLAWAGAADRLNPGFLLPVDPPIANQNSTFDDAQLFTEDSLDHLSRKTETKSLAPLTRHRTTIDHNNAVLRSDTSVSATGDADADTISSPVHKWAAHWPGGSAISAYSLIAVVIAWACGRIYSSYVLQQKSDDLADRVYESESEADDDLHEFIVTQGELAASAQAHSEVTLSIMSHCISSQVNEPQNVSGQQLAEGSLKRINVLSSLGSYTRYEPEGAQVDLHGFVDAVVSDMLRTTPVRPETVVSINDIEQAHLPSEVATPLGLVLFELLENAFLHAFASSSPANYIHLQMKVEENRRREDHSVHLSVQDSGRGFPLDLHTACKANSGLAIVKGLIARLHGEINFANEPSTQISIIVPHIFCSTRHT